MIKNNSDNSIHKTGLRLLAVAAFLVLAGSIIWALIMNDETELGGNEAVVAEITEDEPTYDVSTVASGLQKPWDVTFLPDGTALFTENDGAVSLIIDSIVRRIATIPEVDSSGEGGLTGVAVDPAFTKNRTVYLCYNSDSDVRVVSMKLDGNASKLTNANVIVDEIPSNNSGRHSGCRVAFGPDGYIWIGTGDAADASNPQDPKSLGGKILRVKTDGSPAPGNMGKGFDPRIYSYGHRNTQGIAFMNTKKNGSVGYSIEHGSDIDDEVNPLVKGNFGWDPIEPYVENDVPMTDITKFPGAIRATWSSGDTTQAPSGASLIYGNEWKSWNGALAVAMLKEQHLKIFTFKDDGTIQKEFRVLEDRGRIRDAELAPDGSLYVTTDNGAAQDVVMRITPTNN